jgi:hypothetical protein
MVQRILSIINKMSFLKKILYWGIIPSALVLLWIFLSLLFNSFSPFSILPYDQGPKDVIRTNFKEIHAGKTVKGMFVAQDNFLGIVAVRFNTYYRINGDSLRFRIKEKGDTGWYYENIYKVDQFQPNDFFTFGLPIINSSAGKTYEFEIESVKGRTRDAVAISKINPLFITKYQYPKQLLLANEKIFLLFAVKKIIYFFNSPLLILSTLIYAFPLLLYLFWKLLLYKFFSFQFIFAIFLAITFILYIFYVPQTSVEIIMTLITFWTICLIFNKFDSTMSAAIALVFFIFGEILLILGIKFFAEKSITVTYFFLCVAAIQYILEISLFREKQLVNFNSFTNSLKARFLK